MNLNYASKALNQRLSTDADQVEWKAYKFGQTNVDGGLDDDHMAGAMDDFEGDHGLDDWAENDIANDSAAGGIYVELESRVKLLGDAYPFTLIDNTLIYKNNQLYTYIFCLAVSLQRNITKGEFVLLPRAFELLACEFASCHFGPYANSVHTGWPRSDVDMPKTFKGLADYLNELTGEWTWGPEDGLTDQDSNKIKDAGIDFITWLDTPDRRKGKFYITGQCACGNDWDTKFNDIRPEKYNRWFHPVSWVPAVTAFCTPYRLVDSNLMDASKQAGIVYDRIRLASLSIQCEAHLPVSILEKMKKSIDLVR